VKKILLISVVALLVVTGGMFAYTFTTATATIGVTAPTSDFADITAGGSITAPTVFGKFTGTWPSSTLFDITPDTSTCRLNSRTVPTARQMSREPSRSSTFRTPRPCLPGRTVPAPDLTKWCLPAAGTGCTRLKRLRAAAISPRYGVKLHSDKLIKTLQTQVWA